MICAQCNANNPDSNNFCGTCGYAFPFHETPVRPVVEEQHYTPISGPSLLGLNQSDDDNNGSYLLDDEEHHHRGHAGWYVFSLVAVAILACVGYLEWKAIKTGKVEFPSLAALTGSSTEQPKPQDQPAPPQQTADLKPQSDNTPEPAATEHPLAGDEEAQKQATEPSATAEPAKPASPKEDQAATQQVESRAAKQAAEDRQSASSDDEEDSSEPAKPAAKAKPSAAAKVAEPEQKPPDPRTNRMLVAGEKYLYGRGVRQDCNQALVYFRAAAEEDNAPAMSHLGAMYASGQCVNLDRRTAYSWFARAAQADPHNQWISRNLNMVYRDMTPEERASAR